MKAIEQFASCFGLRIVCGSFARVLQRGCADYMHAMVYVQSKTPNGIRCMHLHSRSGASSVAIAFRACLCLCLYLWAQVRVRKLDMVSNHRFEQKEIDLWIRMEKE